MSWAEEQERFLAEHEISGISVKSYCKKHGINYNSARRYLRVGKSASNQRKKSVDIVTSKLVKAVDAEISRGAYSGYFDYSINELTTKSALTDELALCRSRIHLIIRAINEINTRLESLDDAESAASLYDSLFKADVALERNIARVESVTKTLSALRLDALQEAKIRADTAKSIEAAKNLVLSGKHKVAQTEVAKLQSIKLKRELGGNSRLDDVIDKITGNFDRVVNATENS